MLFFNPVSDAYRSGTGLFFYPIFTLKDTLNLPQKIPGSSL